VLVILSPLIRRSDWALVRFTRDSLASQDDHHHNVPFSLLLTCPLRPLSDQTKDLPAPGSLLFTMRRAFLPLLVSALFVPFESACAFYLPGVAPTTYRAGDVVPVYVNTITPSLSQNDQQLKSLISYDCTLPPPQLKHPPPLCAFRLSLAGCSSCLCYSGFYFGY